MSLNLLKEFERYLNAVYILPGHGLTDDQRADAAMAWLACARVLTTRLLATQPSERHKLLQNLDRQCNAVAADVGEILENEDSSADG